MSGLENGKCTDLSEKALEEVIEAIKSAGGFSFRPRYISFTPEALNNILKIKGDKKSAEWNRKRLIKLFNRNLQKNKDIEKNPENIMIF